MIQLENNSESLRSISQIFTAPSFRKILIDNDYNVMDDRVSKFLSKEGHYNREEVLHFLYKFLYKNYRSEYFYKNTLLNKILLGKYSTNTSTAFDEFKIGFSIADFVLLNGEAKVYEVKTELDSLDKLDKQLSDYSKFADKIHIVTNVKFLPELIDKYRGTKVGLIELTERNTLRTVLEAKPNYEEFDHETIFKTLRKKEYLSITQSTFGYVPDVPNTLIFQSCLELLKKLPVRDFQRRVVKELKKRKLRCPNKLTSKSTPYELKYLCHSLDLEEKQYDDLQVFLNQT
ncbi:sce7726 family protein [Leeuwenhoekiella polynyae]|uniref:Sce7726 family protein n=1 Tax=Leeuwenhoekiella polynyae TaxID=1550906 RepID=A0A4Q0PFP2_9FLAO|nr:sce7726 family protein [Leeuwenhoekiella polynyae]RXG25673.1 hypothetical protein DSM02_840 [Leeuwenhoekiella polynyae]